MLQDTTFFKLSETKQKVREKFYDKPFEVQRAEVVAIEKKVRNIVGEEEPEMIHIPDSGFKIDELELLLNQRRILLDLMFLETPAEVERMRVINDRLFDLTNRLLKKMEDVMEKLKKHSSDDFDDDIEVEGTLRFCFNGEESVLPYEGDNVYGCDFSRMIAVNNWLTGDRIGRQVELHGFSDNVSLDDGTSWAYETAGSFEDICICHTTAVFCRDFGYPLVDVLHMNDFWNEVHVRFQQFATLDPNYKYPRD